MIKISKLGWAIVFGVSVFLLGIAIQKNSQSNELYPEKNPLFWVNSGWSNTDYENWYGLSQGSRLIPKTWFDQLVDQTTGLPFQDRENLSRFGYAMAGYDQALPLGFVIDENAKGEQWLGINCAACHTGYLEYNGEEIRVHGGQTYGNLGKLLDSLNASVAQLKDDPKAIRKLADSENKPVEQINLEIEKWLTERHDIDRSRAGITHWGDGRLDAFAYILARAETTVQNAPREHMPPASAPVDPPFIWNTNQLGKIEYNGIAKNEPNVGLASEIKLGALLRNLGESFGVFAGIDFDTETGAVLTSSKVDNLLTFEQILSKLNPPVWPVEILGSLDPVLMKSGEAIYNQTCRSCHSVLAKNDTTTQMPIYSASLENDQPYVFMNPLINASWSSRSIGFGNKPDDYLIGTDPMMACNIVARVAPTGYLEGQTKKNSKSLSAFTEVYGKSEPTVSILAGILVRDMISKGKNSELWNAYTASEIEAIKNKVSSYFLGKDVGTGFYSASDDEPKGMSKIDIARLRCADFLIENFTEEGLDELWPAYRARNLNGIWATPPFLHNGSVPTLADLLKPQNERPKAFKFAGREYDPMKVGIAVTNPESAGEGLHVYNKTGETILGNWNGGHEFGVDLSEGDKLALLEYLKGL